MNKLFDAIMTTNWVIFVGAQEKKANVFVPAIVHGRIEQQRVDGKRGWVTNRQDFFV